MFIFCPFCIILLRIYVVQYSCCNDSPVLASWDLCVLSCVSRRPEHRMSGHMWLLQLRGTNIFHGLPRHPQHSTMTKYDFKRKEKNRKRQRKTEDQPRINKDQGARENMRRNDRKRIVQASQKNKRTSSVTRLILSRALSARVFPHRQELV